jgi:ribonuclease P protein component
VTERLTRFERVRRRPDFERAYEHGKRLRGRFMTLFVAPNGSVRCRLGVAATRKLGSAVVRNRAKRLARELFRRLKPPAGLDVVVVPRREMLDAPFSSLEADYASTLARRDREKPQSGEPRRRDDGPRTDRSV